LDEEKEVHTIKNLTLEDISDVVKTLVELVQTSQRLYWLSNLWQDGEEEDPRDRDCLERAARLLERIGLPYYSTAALIERYEGRWVRKSDGSFGPSE
jgi:hypothetical protein